MICNCHFILTYGLKLAIKKQKQKPFTHLKILYQIAAGQHQVMLLITNPGNPILGRAHNGFLEGQHQPGCVCPFCPLRGLGRRRICAEICLPASPTDSLGYMRMYPCTGTPVPLNLLESAKNKAEWPLLKS